MEKSSGLISLKNFWHKGLSKIGLKDPCLVKCGLTEIRSTDVFIVSYPKSGNTWVRFMLANAMENELEVTMRNINDYVPGIYNFREQINASFGIRYIKTHDPFFDCYPKMVYIYRDYRDVLISFYYYLRRRDDYKGDLDQFVKFYQDKLPFGTWQEHVQKALEFKEKHPNRMLLVRYEDLIEEPNAQLEKILLFTGIKSKKPLKEIIASTSFEQLRLNEEVHGNVFGDQVAPFFRKGEREQWRAELSDELLNHILSNKNTESAMRKLSYL